ncbi:hypothetical protein ACKI1I_38315 [Streptomyces turgidiscabies]|uniref:Uncharacterized protein n=1 Tax=Streptomyces turgidiscabies (strain Car8) TaxID=698760 RepID=L7EQJ0_STRT8|nr:MULTISPECIES: hypothetical protein [Streptomyces]ELP61718.1 hypothetical protein STRTUCAR8_05904 [Streptomyces turgidiscabies Car8]MDX3499407.1 hypothetical protein [Streptomyces turgidiscabies]GAQ76879.1 hypothetical protein T45_08687 [Streptomyces turgidiscabies]
MSDHPTPTPGDDGKGTPEKESRPNPVPRDLPDQQAGADEDPWDLDDDAQEATGPDERPDPEVPDTDEAGTGRRGAPHSGSPRPEQPVPDEPTA